MHTIFLLAESKERKSVPMPAYAFYVGRRSTWTNKALEYLREKGAAKESIFFLSPVQEALFRYDEPVDPYPVPEKAPNGAKLNTFAARVINELIRMREEDELFVELHVNKSLSAALCPLLKKEGISYRIIGEGKRLGEKLEHYDELIAEEKTKKKYRDLREGKFLFLKDTSFETYEEAETLVTQYETKASLIGITEELGEVKHLLKKRYQREKDARKAKREAEDAINEEGHDDLLRFIESKRTIASLFQDTEEVQEMKRRFPKALKKYTRYLIKENYVIQTENKIHEAMMRLQISLLKAG
ncbi:hypothetical protein IMZ31_20200 (plasmid) [Pontibacillus sp. ALD_SL1]|uniref:DUF6884 domain-containing protein n=1 Tax=Pontibacillus sp. ALD_SL1 TaxID=2777185 RepID=UPI001A96C8F7|nr:DUF6884 domain-containing protein [Pontibacillus sp. ALD_SL1]QST02874.1 hypothetical protein IMZ31_20200 [Pontibacillus sp. ALD_SL1]